MNPKITVFALFLIAFSLSSAVRAAEVEAEGGRAKCAMPSFAQAYKNSAAVFVGEVIKEAKVGDNREFIFRVERYWKGIAAKKVKVLVYENPRYQAQFEKGKSFLVFATEDEDSGILFDGRCSRSAEIGGYSSSLKDDLDKLGAGKTCIDLNEAEGAEVEKEN